MKSRLLGFRIHRTDGRNELWVCGKRNREAMTTTTYQNAIGHEKDIETLPVAKGEKGRDTTAKGDMKQEQTIG